MANNFAFVFPGQGSQAVGMLSEFAGQHSEVQEIFRVASHVVGRDLWDLVCSGPSDELNATENTQPIMLAAGVACYRIWRKTSGSLPSWMAGHSLGEYTALVCSGALQFEDAVCLVKARGTLMQQAVPMGIGAMAAVLGLEDAVVSEVCKTVTEIGGFQRLVSAANFNAPGQVVIAGHESAVKEAIEKLKEKGARRAVLLPVSVPSHCPLMQNIASEFQALLSQVAIGVPEIPVIHNVDAEAHSFPDEIRALLVKQLYSPVRWTDSIKFMVDEGATGFIEGGPGRILSSLIKRIAPECQIGCLDDVTSLSRALEMVI